MKSLFTVICAVLLAGLALPAVAQNHTVPFITYWKQGDSLRFEVTKLKTTQSEGEEEKREERTYNIVLYVAEETESSYLIDFYFEDEFMGIPFAKVATTIFFDDNFDLKVQYKTTETGEYLELTEYKNLQVFLRKMVDVAMENTSNEVAESMKALESLYSSKEVIESRMLNEIQLIHYPFGAEFETGDTLYWEEEVPGLYGDGQISSLGKLYFTTVDTAAYYTEFVMETVLDPDDTKAMITEVMENIMGQMKQQKGKAKKMAKKNSKEFAALLATVKYEVSNYIDFAYEYNYGIPIKIYSKKIVDMTMPGQTARQVEEVIVKLLIEE